MKSNKKLSLAKDTVRRLSSEALAGVHGGDTTTAGTNTCTVVSGYFGCATYDCAYTKPYCVTYPCDAGHVSSPMPTSK